MTLTDYEKVFDKVSKIKSQDVIVDKLSSVFPFCTQNLYAWTAVICIGITVADLDKDALTLELFSVYLVGIQLERIQLA